MEKIITFRVLRKLKENHNIFLTNLKRGFNDSSKLFYWNGGEWKKYAYGRVKEVYSK